MRLIKCLLICVLFMSGCKDIEPENKECTFPFNDKDYEQYSTDYVCVILYDTTLVHMSERKYQYALDLMNKCFPEVSIYLCD